MATPLFITGLVQSAGQSQKVLVNRGFRMRASRPAQLTTALPAANDDLTYTAKAFGTAGNSVRVRYVVAGANTPLSVTVAVNDITVNVATSAGSAATSTAAQVRDAVRASAPATALVSVALAPGNDGTGVVSALGFTNLAGGTDPSATERGEIEIVPGTLFQVDIDSTEVRKRLGRSRDRWVEVPSGAMTRLPVRSLLVPSSGDASQSFISRGFRIPGKGLGFVGTDINQRLGPADGIIEVDLTNPTVRRALRQHMGEWSVAAPPSTASNLITIRGLLATGSVPGGGLSGRGFRIENYRQTGGAGSGTIATVTPTTNVQVDLSNFNVRRALRRNWRRWVVVSAP